MADIDDMILEDLKKSVESDEEIRQKLNIGTKSKSVYTFPDDDDDDKPPSKFGLGNGVVLGKVRYWEAGDLIDCTKVGKSGISVPRSMHGITNVTTDDALFILVVENYSAFFTLSQKGFYKRFPCIIVTSNGNHDVPTALFLRKLNMELNLPVLALINCHLKGLNLLSFYRSGVAGGYLDVKWLGMRPTDFAKYHIPQIYSMEMSKTDIMAAKLMLKGDFRTMNPDCVNELNLMLKTKQIAETEALICLGFGFLDNVYLPLKLQHKDWLHG